MTFILQLSDLHLFADQEAQLKGVSPWRSLRRVLAAVHGSGMTFDHVVVSGDLAHDGLGRTYEHVREALGDLWGRTWLIPGNHDERSLVERNSFRSLANRNGMNSAEPDRVTFSFAVDSWHVIGLDTLVPGELRGELGREQLDWLKTELAARASLPTLVFMHHPPVEVGSAWLDRIGLTDREAFVSLIESSPQVKLICCGHIHQEFESRIGTAAVLATPSTSVQFAPRTETLVVDDLPPGFRIVSLEGENFTSHVVRAADQHFRS